MPGDTISELLSDQDWLDPVGATLQKGVRAAYGKVGTKVRDALHGVWLGHPLHSALTDVPIGAWTTAVLLDALESTTDRKDLQPGADAAVAIGLAGAVGAAITGLTDYQHVGGSARRVGIVHGLLNIVTTGFFTASFMARRRGSRSAGKALGAAGLGFGLVAAKIGGELVYTHKIGVNHTETALYPSEFTPIMGVSELKDGDSKRVEVNGVPLLVVKRGVNIFAIAETCSHLGGPLSEGTITADTVQCPWHGSCFSLQDGRIINGPAVYNQPCMEVRITGDQIEIRRQTDTSRSGKTDKAA
jgi:nitrite reductase/ring-hydroxylating ferredoxin subunit/uncharacterized membrane protein